MTPAEARALADLPDGAIDRLLADQARAHAMVAGREAPTEVLPREALGAYIERSGGFAVHVVPPPPMPGGTS